MDGTLTMRNGKIDKYLFEGGYAQASVAGSTTDNFAFFYYNKDVRWWMPTAISARSRTTIPSARRMRTPPSIPTISRTSTTARSWTGCMAWTPMTTVPASMTPYSQGGTGWIRCARRILM